MDFIYALLGWLLLTIIIIVVLCETGKKDTKSYFTYNRKYQLTSSSTNPSSNKQTKSSGNSSYNKRYNYSNDYDYDLYNYSDAEDFYEGNYDDFDGIDDAESYYDDAWN